MSERKPTWDDLLRSVSDELVHMGADPFDVAAVLLSPIGSDAYTDAQARLCEQMKGLPVPEPLQSLMAAITTAIATVPVMLGEDEG